ncbi:MAG: 4-alpha-glucanotransferase, partial [Verrucomicrobiales bacterium]
MKSPHGRSAGILLPAFSPRRHDDLGIGDTRSFRDWIDWAAEHQVGFLQLLPIQETGDDNSPYNAISSIALEPVYLSCDPGDLPGITADEVADVRFSMGAALHD